MISLYIIICSSTLICQLYSLYEWKIYSAVYPLYKNQLPGVCRSDFSDIQDKKECGCNRQ